jgi:DNA-binding beta-propeller fold protein YncE
MSSDDYSALFLRSAIRRVSKDEGGPMLRDGVRTLSQRAGWSGVPMLMRLFLTAAAVVLAATASASAQNFKDVGSIQLPGTPINEYGVLTIDQATGLGYLADKDNKAVVVFDIKTDKYVSRITGFVGIAGSGNASGPNGLVIVNGGAALWVSDGDSTIKVVDLKSHTITATFATGGKLRANAMAFDPNNRAVIVANSNDAVPFFSLISTEPGHKMLARLPVPQSAENLERSAWHAPSGTFFTAIPVFTGDQSKGLLAQTDAKSGTILKLHELERCHPHSLSIVSDTTIFLGCSNAHGPNRKPGGDMAIFDIASGKIESYGAGLGGNGGSTFNPARSLYLHATTGGALVVIDTKTRQLVQKVPTWNGSRSLGVNLATHKVYVATTAKSGPCGGCIKVFAPE